MTMDTFEKAFAAVVIGFALGAIAMSATTACYYLQCLMHL